MSSISTTDYKICLLLIKYIPIISVIIQIIYLGLFLIDIKADILLDISGLSLLYSVIFYTILKVFKFCIIQKCIITYNVFTDLILSIGLNIHFILFIIGIFIIIITLKLKT